MDNRVSEYIAKLVEKYKYRVLPKAVKQEAHDFYRSHLNGFESTRPLTINGELLAKKYNRVVVGDYGAYVEFEKDDLLLKLVVPAGQRWRYNDEYLLNNGLTIKYHWLQHRDVKIYHQVAGVKYADYIPGKMYVSVTAFDPLSEVKNV